MIRYLKNRLRAYIDRVVDSKIGSLEERMAERAKSCGAIDYDNLAGSIDISDLALQFDTADIAGEVEHDRLASYICLSTLAENFDALEIASHVDMDYKCLAAAILKELRPVEVRPSA